MPTAIYCRILGPVFVLMSTALVGAQQAPTTRPAEPATRPAEQVMSVDRIAATNPSTRPTSLSLNFKDAPLDSVLDYLSEKAGFVVIKEGAVDGRVTVLSKQPVTSQEAVMILNTALKQNGFTAIQSGRELHIVARDKAKKGNVPVHFGADPQDIPVTDELITQVIPIQNIDANKLQTELKMLMAPEADVTANEGSNAIVITDTSANIHRIVQIIADLDRQEMAATDMRIVQLHWAKADSAVKLLESIFKPEGGGGGPPQPGQPVMMGPNGPQGPPQAGGSSARRAHGQIHAAADDRTNTIVVTGPSDMLKIVDTILKELDANRTPTSVIRAFPLKYADAESTSKLIDSIFHPKEQNNDDFPFFFRRFGNEEQNAKIKVETAFDDRTNTVIVTAPAEAMAPIEEVIKTLDASPGSATDIRVFPLKFADSYSTAKLINSIFNPQQDTGPRLPFFFIFGEGSNGSKKGVKINATSDDRTNTVIVTAPVETMKIIEKIVHQVDAKPGSEDTMFIYHLRNAQAQNLEVVLNTLFGNIQNGNQQNPNQQQQQGPQQNQNGFGNRPGGQQGNRGLGSNQNNQARGGRLSNRPNNRQQLQPGMAQAVNELTGMVFVVADPDTNSLLVTTATRYEQEVREIIAELDHPVPQVLIKVLVAEVTHDNSADFGLDFSILNQRPNGNGQKFGQTFGQPGNGMVISFLENNLNATLHALATQGKLDVLSRPYVLASDNQAAHILVGDQVPLIINSYITEFGQQINGIQYNEVGIIVDVTPHINGDGLVTLDVSPEISQLTGNTVQTGPNSFAPVISDRSAYSRVAVRDGQTVVIGGLMQDQKTSTVNKVPILGDIPLIGYAFSRTQVTKTKTELLIFLTPHVALQPDLLKPMSQDELKGTRLTPNAVERGMWDEHLKGMERGGAPGTTQPIQSPIFVPSPSSQPSHPAAPATQPGAGEQTVRSQEP